MKAEVTFGGWLKRRRGGMGLTQKELAQQVGYAEVTLRKVEADELRPSRQMAEKLAEVLQIEPENWMQFVQFARDELGWTEVSLPTQPSSTFSSSPYKYLPIQPTAFIGRVQELATVASMLANPNCRLLTLIGPGGIGKTRLALQVAAEHSDIYADGVRFVPLISLTSAELLVSTIAAALNFPFSGLNEPRTLLLNYLSEKKLLLVMDNFEHLLEEVTLLATILQQAPNVTMLVTSRERLNIQGEWVFDVGGLETPASTENVSDEKFEHYSSVALFLQRVHQIHFTFTPSETEKRAIIRICQLVQGMPLAIELAASWARVLSCMEIVQGIEQGLSTLTTTLHDVPVRHRSLQAVFEHSWRLLSLDEQHVCAQLSVFRGSFTREAARQVAGASLWTLQALIDKSLLRGNSTGHYEIHEFVRQFTQMKLQEQGDWAATQERHEAYFVAMSEDELHALRERFLYPSQFKYFLPETNVKDKTVQEQNKLKDSQAILLPKQKVIRVLMMSWEYFPYAPGGLGKHVTELVSALSQVVLANIPLLLDILAPRFADGELIESLNSSVTIYRVEMPVPTRMSYNSVVTNNALFIETANSLIQQYKYDLIHIHDWQTGMAGIHLKHQWTVPLLTTIHGSVREFYPDKYPSDTYQIEQLGRKICNEAEQIIVCSQFMGQELNHYWGIPYDKINVIPNGVKVNQEEKKSAAELMILHQHYAPKGEKLLFFIGPTIPQKGLLVLIRAMPLILANHPDTRLLVATAYGDKLRTLAYELNVENAIDFLGYISDYQRDCLYQIVDATIIPSLYEPFCLVALEAMALGCNVIASNVGGLGEVIKHMQNGLLIHPNDPQSIMHAVNQLFKDPVSAQKQRAYALNEINTLYRWEKIAEQTVEVYKSLTHLSSL